jgi:type I restriction enzyme R subunit
LRKNITIDWSKRESMQVRLRLMVKRILRKYKYPPYMAEDAVQLLLSQAENLGDEWV